MGENFIAFYQKKVRKEYRIAFFFTFFAAMLIHIYKFVNTLPNHDSVLNYYADQNILGSGRWALSWACGISTYWDLPWVIGLLSCIFIALTVVVIAALFRLKNPVLIGLIGTLLAASPSTTETFFFLFTADGYMIAMFLAALAVYLSRIEETRKLRWGLSGICICVSCGIYQAYVSFALILAVCYLIDVLFQNNHSKKDCLKWILRQAIIYIVSLAAYFVIWKLCLYFTGTPVNDYQGISEVGKFSVGTILKAIPSSVESIMKYFLQWNVAKYGLTFYGVLSIIFLVVLAVALVISCIKSHIWKRKWAVVLLALCLVTIVPFACIWHFTSDTVVYRAMMLQSLVLLFVLTAVLYERWAKQGVKNTVCLFLMLVAFNNALMANVGYFYLSLSYERTYAEGVDMMAEIHDLQEEYEIKDIAVVGTRAEDVMLPFYDKETGKATPSGQIHIFTKSIEESLLIDAKHIVPFLKTNFGMDLDPVTEEKLEELAESAQVKSMGCWPSDDSFAVIDGTLVIKLANQKTSAESQ